MALINNRDLTAGFKKPLSSASEVRGMDLHVWVVCEDGSIKDYDNDLPFYKKCRAANNLTSERCYHAMPQHEAKKVWKRIVKQTIKPNIRFIRDEPAYAFKFVEARGTLCHMRAYLVAQRLVRAGVKCKIAVGSMGWRAQDGRVWWEFG